jgi:hypothetical protein
MCTLLQYASVNILQVGEYQLGHSVTTSRQLLSPVSVGVGHGLRVLVLGMGDLLLIYTYIRSVY